jgi:hypothetical protein
MDNMKFYEFKSELINKYDLQSFNFDEGFQRFKRWYCEAVGSNSGQYEPFEWVTESGKEITLYVKIDEKSNNHMYYNQGAS